MTTKKTIEQSTTEEGCNVTTVIHENGHEAVTLDTGRHPVLVLEEPRYELRGRDYFEGNPS
jgi:hypothetical protein